MWCGPRPLSCTSYTAAVRRIPRSPSIATLPPTKVLRVRDGTNWRPQLATYLSLTKNVLGVMGCPFEERDNGQPRVLRSNCLSRAKTQLPRLLPKHTSHIRRSQNSIYPVPPSPVRRTAAAPTLRDFQPGACHCKHQHIPNTTEASVSDKAHEWQ